MDNKSMGISLEDLEEKLKNIKYTPTEKIYYWIKWNVLNPITSAIGWLTGIVVRLAFRIHPDGAWKAVVNDVRNMQIWELMSFSAEFILPRLDKYIENCVKGKCGIPATYYKKENTYIQDLKAVSYFLQVIAGEVDTSMSKDDNDLYDRGKEVFGRVFETLWD